MMYFFEWDLLDMWFEQPRLAAYHARHHNELTENFSVFGLVSDDAIRSLFRYTKWQEPIKKK